MTRLVRDFVEIREHTPLDEVIQMLQALRETVGIEDAELRMRGNDAFGRRMSISYLRPQTAEEAACDARYAHVALTVVEADAPAELRIAA